MAREDDDGSAEALSEDGVSELNSEESEHSYMRRGVRLTSHLQPQYTPAYTIHVHTPVQDSTGPAAPIGEEHPRPSYGRHSSVKALEERRDQQHSLQIRQRRAEILCTRGDAHPEMLTLIGQLAPWRLSSTMQKSEATHKQAVKVTAQCLPILGSTMWYNLSTPSEPKQSRNWDICTLVLELKDGDVVVNVDIKQYIKDQLARGQGSVTAPMVITLQQYGRIPKTN